MMNTLTFTTKQLEMVRAIKEHIGKNKRTITHNELLKFVNEKLNLKYTPNFITQNVALKHHDKDGNIVRGVFVLPSSSNRPSRSKAAVKVTEVAPDATPRKSRSKKHAATAVVEVEIPVIEVSPEISESVATA